MSTQAERFTAALEVLREKGWTKRQGSDIHGRMCAGVAICMGYRRCGLVHSQIEEEALYRTDQEVFVGAANDLFPVGIPDGDWDGIVEFNDFPWTTFAMVEQVFEKSIVRAQEMEATL